MATDSTTALSDGTMAVEYPGRQHSGVMIILIIVARVQLVR